MTTVAASSGSQAQEVQQRKRRPPPAQDALRFEAIADGAPGEKEAAQGLIAAFQQHGSVLECSFNLLPCPDKVRSCQHVPACVAQERCCL